MEKEKMDELPIEANPGGSSKIGMIVTIIVALIFIVGTAIGVYLWQSSSCSSTTNSLSEQLSVAEQAKTAAEADLSTKTTENETLKAENDEFKSQMSAMPQVGTDEFLYYNPYGMYMMVFPEEWDLMYSDSYRYENTTFGKITQTDFGFYSTELSRQIQLFTVYEYTPTQWEDIQAANDGPVPTLITETTDYVYAYSESQDVADKSYTSRLTEVKSIVQTLTPATASDNTTSTTTDADTTTDTTTDLEATTTDTTDTTNTTDTSLDTISDTNTSDTSSIESSVLEEADNQLLP